MPYCRDLGHNFISPEKIKWSIPMLSFLSKPDSEKKKKTIRTFITFASQPSCFTPSLTMTCEPVTRIGIVTIHAASAHAILTIVAKLTLCNFF